MEISFPFKNRGYLFRGDFITAAGSTSISGTITVRTIDTIGSTITVRFFYTFLFDGYFIVATGLTAISSPITVQNLIIFVIANGTPTIIYC